MTDKPIKIPGPDHPITIAKAPAASSSVWAEGDRGYRRALSLQEASYPGVKYIPRNDVDMSLLERTDHTTYCPYKGDAAISASRLVASTSRNAVWSYEKPYDAVAEIRDHLAFYPDRVDAIEEIAAG